MARCSASFSLYFHPPLQQFWISPQEIAHCCQHSNDENHPVEQSLPVMKCTRQSKEDNRNYKGRLAEPDYHKLPQRIQPLLLKIASSPIASSCSVRIFPLSNPLEYMLIVKILKNVHVSRGKPTNHKTATFILRVLIVDIDFIEFAVMAMMDGPVDVFRVSSRRSCETSRNDLRRNMQIYPEPSRLSWGMGRNPHGRGTIVFAKRLRNMHITYLVENYPKKNISIYLDFSGINHQNV
jgi:hypothetical protein